MTDRNLTVARLVTEHIDGITVEGDAFGDLLDSLGIAEKIEQRYVVRSEKAGDPDTRAEGGDGLETIRQIDRSAAGAGEQVRVPSPDIAPLESTDLADVLI
jgi:hypothetical protein